MMRMLRTRKAHWKRRASVCSRPMSSRNAVLALKQETYAYAKTMLDVATAGADGRGRALIVGGGISNFTDVAATFKGIIQV